MGTRQEKKDQTLAIAHMGYKQAIVTTTISALAGLLGILLGLNSKSVPTPSKEFSLQIIGVECPQGCNEVTRVLVTINGKIPYSYPARGMLDGLIKRPKERFPVPNYTEYYIAFEGLTNDLRIISGGTELFEPSDFPLKNERTISLGPIDVAPVAASSPRYLIVRYDIR